MSKNTTPKRLEQKQVSEQEKQVLISLACMNNYCIPCNQKWDYQRGMTDGQ